MAYLTSSCNCGFNHVIEQISVSSVSIRCICAIGIPGGTRIGLVRCCLSCHAIFTFTVVVPSSCCVTFDMLGMIVNGTLSFSELCSGCTSTHVSASQVRPFFPCGMCTSASISTSAPVIVVVDVLASAHARSGHLFRTLNGMSTV